MSEARRELWKQADSVLDTLLDLPGPERESRLCALTSDETLRARVRRLLAAHAHSGGLLDAPPPLVPPAPSLHGHKLGRWRLREEIGRGGMAVVYRGVAEDGAQGQQAAIKVLTLGTLAQSGRERFLHEQQALLRLRHPYIAALYDAGVAADGTPWLAMALVDGEPIDRWCDERGLDPAARVRLVLQACEAFDCSHRNLVVHRDVKPSNVLVDEGGHVRVLDFGIARLLGDADAARTRTQLHALTPEYAAPEQFAGAPPSTAMDVYGAGALLYRLLAGKPPQRDARGELTLPSRALRTTRGGAVAPPESLLRAKRLRGDLDTIAAKALAERPEDRYAGISALADDLRRWLEKRPIRARPPSLRYRFGRFVSRNRWQVAAGAALSLSVLAGVGGVLWQARKARIAAEESQAQLNYINGVLEALAPGTQEDRELDRTRLLAEAAQRARSELAGRPRLLASVELGLGGVAERIGDYAQAAKLYDDAHALRRASVGADSVEAGEALAQAGAVLGSLDPPQVEEAERRLVEAEAVLRRRAPASGQWVDAAQKLAKIYAESDRYPQAIALLGDTAEPCVAEPLPLACERALMTLASLHARTGEHPEVAIAAFEKIHDARIARLGEEHADTLFAATQLGELYYRNGQRQRGLDLLEHSYAAQKRIYAAPNEATLGTLQKLATALYNEGAGERALAMRQEHLVGATQLFGEHSPKVALGHADYGSLLFSEGRFAEAEREQHLAHAIYAGYAGGADSAGALLVQANLAEALREQGRAREALPLARASADGIERIFGAQSGYLGNCLAVLARSESALGQHAQALQHFDRAVAIYAANPADGIRHANARAGRARAMVAAGRAAEAETELRTALRDIDASPDRTERAYWEGHAALVQAACAAGDGECAQLRSAARAALGRQMPGIARLRLRRALAETGG